MRTATAVRSRRRGPGPAPQLMRPDAPWTMRLRDGRTLAVEIPGRWTTQDRDGSLALLPPAVHFLDRLQVLFSPMRTPPSPAYIKTLREALGLTQTGLGERLGVAKITISRWERGDLRPGGESLAKLESLRREVAREGAVFPG
jgi:DNA-binding XRE family transcriptional regulator